MQVGDGVGVGATGEGGAEYVESGAGGSEGSEPPGVPGEDGAGSPDEASSSGVGEPSGSLLASSVGVAVLASRDATGSVRSDTGRSGDSGDGFGAGVRQ